MSNTVTVTADQLTVTQLCTGKIKPCPFDASKFVVCAIVLYQNMELKICPRWAF